MNDQWQFGVARGCNRQRQFASRNRIDRRNQCAPRWREIPHGKDEITEPRLFAGGHREGRKFADDLTNLCAGFGGPRQQAAQLFGTAEDPVCLLGGAPRAQIADKRTAVARDTRQRLVPARIGAHDTIAGAPKHVHGSIECRELGPTIRVISS